MKYIYQNTTGTTEIEVDEQFHDLLVTMDREEFNSDRKHSRRYPISLENCEYEGEWFEDKKNATAEVEAAMAVEDALLACKNAVTMRVIAKDYGWSAQRMNAFLHDHGIQYKQGGVWLLYQNHAANGYTDTKTHVHQGSDGEMKSTIHTYWTQKGRLFIYEKMKAAGYLPLIERGVEG
jgi:phage antirepressor YoqD-like protein